MKKIIALCFLGICAGKNATGQSFEEYKQRAQSNFKNYREEQQRKFKEYRDRVNAEFAEYMKQAWKPHGKSDAIPKPEEEPTPPVVLPEEERDKPVKSRPMPIGEVVHPPLPEPQPKPIAPIMDNPTPAEKRMAFTLFGTTGEVRFPSEKKFALEPTDATLSKTWKKLCDDDLDNTLYDCLSFREKWQLCDWAYLTLLDRIATACSKDGNSATFLTAFLFCQSGYQMRIGRANKQLYLLYASKHTIYQHPYFEIEGEKYYVWTNQISNVQQMEICDVAYPNEKSLSLLIPYKQAWAYAPSEQRVLQAKRYPDVKAETSVNKNLIDFYNTYPSSEFGGNMMTRWAAYANTPLEEEAKQALYSGLLAAIHGLGDLHAANRLLNFVQTAFVYEFDDKVWGGDRAFFAEETLYYPYCDCEDRSIFFSRLVRDLLQLNVVLVYYPGHLATAVHFNEEVEGDYISVNGKKYIVCDPTYIGAPVGKTMPNMDNQNARVILLN